MKWPPLKRAVTHCEQGGGAEPLFMLRCDWSPVMLTWFRQPSVILRNYSLLRGSKFDIIASLFSGGSVLKIRASRREQNGS